MLSVHQMNKTRLWWGQSLFGTKWTKLDFVEGSLYSAPTKQNSILMRAVSIRHQMNKTRFEGSLYSSELTDYLRAQSQGHRTIDLLEERMAREEEALDDLPWKDETWPSSIKRTLNYFRASVGQTSKTVGVPWFLRAHKFWTELRGRRSTLFCGHSGWISGTLNTFDNNYFPLPPVLGLS